MFIDLQRLRELEFLSPDEEVLSIEEGKYRVSSDNAVCSVDIHTSSGLKRIWLKSYLGAFGSYADPEDFTRYLESTSASRVNIAKMLSEAGAHIPKTEIYDKGTLIQAHVDGISYDEARRDMKPDEFEGVERNKEREFKIYRRFGSGFFESGNNLIVTPEKYVYLVDLGALSLPR